MIRNTPGGLQGYLRERSRVPTFPVWQRAGKYWCTGSPWGSSPFSQLLRGSVCSSPEPLRKKDHQERMWSYLLYIQFCLSGSNHPQQKPTEIETILVLTVHSWLEPKARLPAALFPPLGKGEPPAASAVSRRILTRVRLCSYWLLVFLDSKLGDAFLTPLSQAPCLHTAWIWQPNFLNILPLSIQLYLSTCRISDP